MSGFVVVLVHKQPGVVGFPSMPGLERLMRSQVEMYQQSTGRSVESPPQYLESSDRALSFTADRSEARVFRSAEAAQAAIDRIPENIRPSGLSVRPVD